MSRLWQALRTPTFVNTGSTARDHLASERTFLAWLRTGLGFIALGIAIERFSTLEPLIKYTIHAIDPASPPSPRGESGKSTNDSTRKDEHGTNRTLTMATSFTLLGSAAILYGTQRYVTNLRMLQRGLYRPAFWGVAGFVGAVVGITAYGVWDSFVKSAAVDEDAARRSDLLVH